MTAPGQQDWEKDFTAGVEPGSAPTLAASLPGTGAESVAIEDEQLPPEARELGAPRAAFDDTGEFAYLPLGDLFESPSNPRKHFDPVKLAELTESVKKSGVLEALVVRPVAQGKRPTRYEIGAGHRRYRAAKAAGVAMLPCRIRAMSDPEFMELLTVSNLQRDDVHPLEEADGYRALMEKAGYDVARIAERVGRSVKYVYDRLKLLQLTKEAKALFLEGKMTAGHAILLARLTPADQARAIASDGDGNGRIGGLFTFENVDGPEELDLGGDEPTKPVSVREFGRWIDENVRFAKAAPDPMLFPETAAIVQAAAEKKAKVIGITHDYHIPLEAKADGERTYGPTSWKRADGEKAYDPTHGTTVRSRPCDRSVLGVIVVGPERGAAFQVCVDKKCGVHWPEQKKADGAKASKDDWRERERKQAAERAKQQEREKAIERRWEKATPAILAAIADKVKKAPAGARGILADLIVRHVSRGSVNAQLAIGRGTTAEDLVRHVAYLILAQVIRDRWQGPRDFPRRAKAFGVDVAKILDEVAPEERPATTPKQTGKKGECEICECTEKKACPGGCAWDPKYLAQKRYVCTNCSKQADALIAKATKKSGAKTKAGKPAAPKAKAAKKASKPKGKKK